MNHADAIRTRPAMYLGNNVVKGLLEGLMLDTMAVCGTDGIRFEITLMPKQTFSVALKSASNLEAFAGLFTTEADTEFYHARAVRVLSSSFMMEHDHGHRYMSVRFSLDEQLTLPGTTDFYALADDLKIFAILHRGCEIVVSDRREGEESRLYFHFPDGVAYLFRTYIGTLPVHPLLKVCAGEQAAGKHIEICIGYRKDRTPESVILSFANEIYTSGGGSLVNGALAGIKAALKQYAYEDTGITADVTKQKMLHGLVLICAVRTREPLEYAGATKEELVSDSIYHAAKKIARRHLLDTLRSDAPSARRLLSRYDDDDILGRLC